MNRKTWKRMISLLSVLALTLSLCACKAPGDAVQAASDEGPRILVAVEDEPDTVDFQCTTIHYTIAQNVFDRLVDLISDADGNAVILPMLAERWEISDDRRSYTFHLRDGVRFSNGCPLTADDVLYTFTRLLTWPESCNQDIADDILGAAALERGEADTLQGFQVLSDLDFTVTLEQPFEAFLACLSMPGASILDRETTEAAGARFGREPEWTVGTGSFILESWEAGKGMTLSANRDCWQGAPHCDGLDLRFMTDPEEIRLLFERGGLDLLNLDDVGKAAEFFLHGDESLPPLDDVRVRKALQLALNRALLLDAAYSGYGTVENGIMPHGLAGFDPELAELRYDPALARELLEEAGYADGLSLRFSASSSSSLGEMALIRMAVSQWEKVGVHASIEVLPESEFMRLRKSGALACYSATWTADYDDPDNFFYTFFGSADNSRYRSLCYPREEIMQRVRKARTIAPLFSRLYLYVSSERLEGIQSSWNGSVKNKYREMSINEARVP